MPQTKAKAFPLLSFPLPCALGALGLPLGFVPSSAAPGKMIRIIIIIIIIIILIIIIIKQQ